MSAHPYVVLKGEIRKNPFFVLPEVYLREMIAKKPRYSRRQEQLPPMSS